MKMLKPLLASLALSVAACSSDLPSEKETGFNASGYASPLSDSEYSSLSPEQQYQITNNLLGTLYKGIAADEFFDLSNGMNTQSLKEGKNFLAKARQAVATPLSAQERSEHDLIIDGCEDELECAQVVEPRFTFRTRPKELPLARIFQYPLSKDMFDHWIAYVLANSILFSPAEENDSADITDVQNVYRRLVLALADNQDIRQIVLRHQMSVENWRRFRSPEDNTREMIEIFLGLVDRDDDVPRASTACQDWYLTDESEGYKLARTDFPNNTPQLVLDSYVTTCEDFYQLIASHPLLVPRVTGVLVNYFFAQRSTEDKKKMVDSIVQSNPTTFQEIFTAIVFSKQYLMHTERPKSFEESFFNLAHRMKWDPSSEDNRRRRDLFQGLISNRGGAARAYLSEMNWAPMVLKLGRTSDVPLDSLSFANYHKGLREVLLLDNTLWQKGLGLYNPGELPQDATAEEAARYQRDLALYNPVITALPVEDYLDYLFVTVAGRKANDTEKTDLITILDGANQLITEDDGRKTVRTNRHDDSARIVFDYLSRLPEIYYINKFN